MVKVLEQWWMRKNVKTTDELRSQIYPLHPWKLCKAVDTEHRTRLRSRGRQLRDGDGDGGCFWTYIGTFLESGTSAHSLTRIKNIRYAYIYTDYIPFGIMTVHYVSIYEYLLYSRINHCSFIPFPIHYYLHSIRYQNYSSYYRIYPYTIMYLPV